ncbi:MAG: iron-containing alcohol dehydrogenase, partial [Chloroflexi bacterium]|nr:iron-containing alcohol dehydrogenase [Chloroflexota bacterium]
SASHGAVCARLLPLVMQTNIHALNERQKESHVIRRYQQVAQFLTGKPDASAEDGVFWVQSLVTELKIPGLSEYGMTAGDIADVVPQAARASSMQGNPIKLTDAELSDILYQAL